jgi:hypothetical protein
MVFGKAPLQTSGFYRAIGGLIFQVDSLVAYDVEPEAQSANSEINWKFWTLYFGLILAYYVEVRSAIHAHV